MRNRLGFFYGILVALLLVMGAWWVYFMSHQGKVHAQIRLQKLDNDRLHALFLIQSDPHVQADPERWLGNAFPQLVFRRSPEGIQVEAQAEVLAEIDAEARRTRNMFLYEGFFFLVLLAAGSTILVLSWRSEVRFKEARELFLAGATHEFKTPLASLRLYTETLGRDGVAESDRAQIRGRMVQDILRLEELVNEVLAMSAGDTFSDGPRVLMDLADECEEVVHDIRGFASGRGAQIRLDTASGCTIRGNRLTFSLALRNLIVNAVRHSPAPVTVLVRLTPGERWHLLEVRDDGPGIPRRLHDKVFDCFYSGGREGRASGGGLGLYLVKRNVEQLGGRIELASEDGHGCTFTMRLPAQVGSQQGGRE